MAGEGDGKHSAQIGCCGAILWASCGIAGGIGGHPPRHYPISRASDPDTGRYPSRERYPGKTGVVRARCRVFDGDHQSRVCQVAGEGYSVTSHPVGFLCRPVAREITLAVTGFAGCRWRRLFPP